MENICSEKNKKLCTVLISIVCLLLAVLTISTIVDVQNKIKEGRYIGQEIESKNNITVSATGEVYTKPDLALTTFSVVTEAKTVEDAMKENTEKMNEVIESVKSEGVESKDLKTTTFSIRPRYEWYENEKSLYYPEGERVLVGYEIQQSLQVKIREMDNIGSILEGATSKGANEVGNLQFTVEDEDRAKEEARNDAIKEAKEKAQSIASQLGVKLIKIISFNEGSSSPRYYGIESAMGVGDSSVSVPQIETGENKITVSVSITYEIN